MDVCPHHQPRGHGGTEDVEVGDAILLTNLSVDGEYASNILSERREWLLRAYSAPSNG